MDKGNTIVISVPLIAHIRMLSLWEVQHMEYWLRIQCSLWNVELPITMRNLQF